MESQTEIESSKFQAPSKREIFEAAEFAEKNILVNRK